MSRIHDKGYWDHEDEDRFQDLPLSMEQTSVEMGYSKGMVAYWRNHGGEMPTQAKRALQGVHAEWVEQRQRLSEKELARLIGYASQAGDHAMVQRLARLLSES